MIDESLAKGLTKQFLAEYQQHTLRMANKFKLTHQVVTSRKSWDKYSTHFLSNANSGIIHGARYGSKRRPYLGWLALYTAETNITKNREESVLLLIRWDLSWHSEDLCDTDINLCLSHHAIQRLFQRSSFQRDTPFQECFLFFKKQLRFLAFWWSIWSSIGINPFHKLPESQTINVPIPAQDGMFLAEVTFLDTGLPDFDIRTFIGDHQMTAEQERIKSLMIESSEPYLSSNFMYIVMSPFCSNEKFNDIPRDRVIGLHMFFHLARLLEPALIEIIDFSQSEKYSNPIACDQMRKAIRNIAGFSDEIIGNTLDDIHHFQWQKRLTKFFKLLEIETKKQAG